MIMTPSDLVRHGPLPIEAAAQALKFHSGKLEVLLCALLATGLLAVDLQGIHHGECRVGR